MLNTSGGYDTEAASTSYFCTTARGANFGSPLVQSVASNSKNGTAQSTVTTTYGYATWDGPLQSSVTVNTQPSSGTATNYSFDGLGQIVSASIQDGRPRTISFVTDQHGRIRQCDEADASTVTGGPHDYHYFFNGIQIGAISNNGTADVDYLTGIQQQTTVQGTGAFRGGSTSFSPYAHFDQSYAPLNPASDGAVALHGARRRHRFPG